MGHHLLSLDTAMATPTTHQSTTHQEERTNYYTGGNNHIKTEPATKTLQVPQLYTEKNEQESK
jgi:hypothetical protein